MCFAFPLEMKGHYDEEPGLWISLSFTLYFNCRNYLLFQSMYFDFPLKDIFSKRYIFQWSRQKCYICVRFSENSYNFSWFYLHWSNKNMIPCQLLVILQKLLTLACFCLLSLFMESLCFQSPALFLIPDYLQLRQDAMLLL